MMQPLQTATREQSGLQTIPYSSYTMRFVAPPHIPLRSLTWAMQMIDKIWYDWQNKSPKNRYAYGGGSAEAMTNYATFSKFPTGLPPYYGVSL